MTWREESTATEKDFLKTLPLVETREKSESAGTGETTRGESAVGLWGVERSTISDLKSKAAKPVTEKAALLLRGVRWTVVEPRTSERGAATILEST